MSNRITDLEYALLGLARHEPRSGYDLRKLFASTPLMHFSQSPGAIYPALARMEGRGLLKGRVTARESLRPKKLYSVTAADQDHDRCGAPGHVRKEAVVRGRSISGNRKVECLIRLADYVVQPRNGAATQGRPYRVLTPSLNGAAPAEQVEQRLGY